MKSKLHIPDSPSPICLQTTYASVAPKPSPHTLPQILLLHTSNLPASVELPLTSRTDPSSQ